MLFPIVVGIVLTHYVCSLIYIAYCCVLGNNKGEKSVLHLLLPFPFSLAYNTTVRFEYLEKLAPLEILESYFWRGIGKFLCLRVDFLLQVKESILLRQKLRSFLFLLFVVN